MTYIKVLSEILGIPHHKKTFNDLKWLELTCKVFALSCECVDIANIWSSKYGVLQLWILRESSRKWPGMNYVRYICIIVTLSRRTAKRMISFDEYKHMRVTKISFLISASEYPWYVQYHREIPKAIVITLWNNTNCVYVKRSFVTRLEYSFMFICHCRVWCHCHTMHP